MATSFSPGATQGGGVKLSLFTNQIIRFAMIVAGCAFAVYLGTEISDPDANALASSVKWMVVAAFLTAVVSPKTGIYLVLFMCPCLDLVKRLLILFSDASLRDVAIVLAMAPVTLVGASIGTFGSRLLLRKTLFEPGEKPLFLFVLVTSTLIIVSDVRHGADSQLALLKEIGGSCVYLSLLYLVPVHFPRVDQIANLFRCLVLAFVPVALYGFWQLFFGLSDFENRYLLSGLTITSGDYIGSGRIFSTLNSNHAFSVTMACCAMIAWLLRYLPTDTAGNAWLKSFSWVFSLLFATACIFSLRRTGWLVIGFSVAGAFCFRSKRRTQFFYSTCLCLLLLIIFNAEWLYTQLPYWEGLVNAALPGHEQAFQLQTFNDRLWSFQTLTDNTQIWTLFGMSKGAVEGLALHDAVTETIVGYGLMGAAVFSLVLVTALFVSHRVVWKSKDMAERGYTVLLLSLLFSNLFVGAIMQTHIEIFPISFIFWLCAGALTTVTFKKAAVQAAAVEQESLEPIDEPPEKGKTLVLNYT